MNRRTWLRRNFAVAVLSSSSMALPALALPALAQSPAHKPAHTKLIVPLSVGSTVDVVARVLGQHLGDALGRPVVVENRPGAAGLTGTQQIVTAAADGATLGIVSSNHAINPSIYKSIPFDSIKDITPIGMIGTVPLVLVAHPSVPASSLQDLIDLLKSKPGQLNFGSAGNGSTLHLAGELFAQQAGVEWVHIPYNGTGPLTTDLVAGQVDVAFVSVTAVAPHIRSGKLKALGVSTPERVALLPEVPSVSESGLPDYAFDAWMALIGPANLPETTLTQVDAALQQALANPKVQETFALQGIAMAPMPRQDLRAYFGQEQQKYADLVARSGAKLE